LARKTHDMPLSGGDRKAVTKELSKARRHHQNLCRAVGGEAGEVLIREADNLA
jgi:hypothetical protein